MHFPYPFAVTFAAMASAISSVRRAEAGDVAAIGTLIADEAPVLRQRYVRVV